MKEVYKTRELITPFGRSYYGTVTITKRKWHVARWSVGTLDNLADLSDHFIGGPHEDGALESIHAEWKEGINANAHASSNRAMFWGGLRWGVVKGVDYATAIAVKDQVLALWEGRIQKWLKESEEATRFKLTIQ